MITAVNDGSAVATQPFTVAYSENTIEQLPADATLDVIVTPATGITMIVNAGITKYLTIFKLEQYDKKDMPHQEEFF